MYSGREKHARLDERELLGIFTSTSPLPNSIRMSADSIAFVW